MWQDLRYGLRALRKNPGFSLVAVITLALGIGANTALFSIVNGVLLNPLPFPHANELVALHESKPNFNQGSISYPNFLDWQRNNRTFASIAIYRNYSFTITGAGEPQQVPGAFLSSSFFTQLGVRALIGRTFLPGEDQIGANPVALISENLWKNTFGGAPDILTKTITLNGSGYAIAGVIPAAFHLQFAGFRQRDIYAPIGQWNNPLLMHRDAGLGIHGLGRLKPGVTLDQARADMRALNSQLAEAYPATNRGLGAAVVPLRESMLGRVQPLLLLLLGAVGFVLLIACVNVANLQLARSNGRAREFAIRAALGAGRARVVRQLTVEGLLLAAAGAATGVWLASFGTAAVLRTLPESLPRSEEIGLDARVLAFTAVIAILAGVLAAISPALFRSGRFDLRASMQQGNRGAAGHRSRAQGVFVAAEIALALVLLSGAGLMLRSLTLLWRIDPGFDPHHVLTFGVTLSPPTGRDQAAANRAALRELETTLARVPGVESASETWEAVPFLSDDERLFWIDGQPRPATDNDMNWAIDYVVSPSYLATMRIPLRRGRFFAATDDEHAPRVAAVDDVFAAKYFPNQDPIGKRLHFTIDSDVQIVGVVQHVRQWGLDTDDSNSLRAQIYFADMQMSNEYVAGNGGTGVLVRARTEGPALWDALRRAVHQRSPNDVLFAAQPLDEVIASSLAERRFTMILLAVFAALALGLAGIGIYGVVSYVVGQRTGEIGVRMALGASRGDVLRLILTGGGRLALIGIGAGLAAAFAVTRLLSQWLYGVRPTDPLTFATVSVLLLSIALAACYVPARRASSIDPVSALRGD